MPIPSCISWLTLLLLASSALADDPNLTTVPASACKFPFPFDGGFFYACTTAGDSAAWCVLKSPSADGKDWAYCDQTSVGQDPQLQSIVAQKCSSGWTRQKGNASYTVYGCINDPQNQQFYCQDSSGVPQDCGISSDAVAAALTAGGVETSHGFGKKADGNALAGSVNQGVDAPASGNGSSGVSTAGGAAAAVGCVCGVALLAGLFVAQRRQSSKKTADWTYKNQPSMSEAAFGNATSGYLYSADVLSPSGGVAEKLHNVVSTYSPTLGDELEIQPGDKVAIVIEYDDGWCQGINHSRGGTKGVFPKHCVDMTS